MELGLILFFLALVIIVFLLWLRRHQNLDLTILKDKYNIPLIIRGIEQESDLRFRLDAIKILAEFKDIDTTPLLINILEDTRLEIHLRREAAKAIGTLENPKAILPLIKAMQANDSELSTASYISYQRIKSRISDSLFDIIQAENELDFKTNEKALDEITKRLWLGPINQTLINGSGVRLNDFVNLLLLLNEITYNSLIEVIHKTRGPSRLPALFLISKLGLLYDKAKLKNATESIIKELKDQDDNIRASAALGLGMICDEETIDYLLEALSDNCENVRLSVISVLGGFKDERAFDALIKAANSRDAIVSAIGKTGNPRGVKLLLDMLHEDFAMARFEYPHDIGNLEPLGEPKSIGTIIAALKKIGTKEALSAIKNFR